MNVEKIHVLHVSEAYAGGLKVSLDGYVGHDLPVAHSLVYNARRFQGLTPDPPRMFENVRVLPEGHVRAVACVISAIKELRPDVVHAHSSFAGVYARIAGKVTATPVIYTPHGLATERQDISGWKRALFAAIEKSLAPMTTLFAGCSTYESICLKAVAGQVPVTTIPNALSPEKIKSLPKWVGGTAGFQPTVCFVGRITPARAPEDAAEIGRLLRERGIRCVWIGDGASELKELIASAGIDVLGWKSGRDLYESMARADVAIHTSKWDGFPMAVLEDLAIGIPLVVSDIPALFECPPERRFKTAREAVAAIVDILENHPSADWSEVLMTYNPDAQKKALQEAYALVLRQKTEEK